MDQQEDKAVVQKAEESTSQTKSPQVEAPSTDVQTPKGEISPEGVSDEIPEDEHERRRAFQEQRQEIKRLKEESALRQKSESAFAPFRQPVVPPTNLAQQAVRVEDYIDPITGEVSRPAYNAAIQAEAARQASIMASQSVQEQLDEYQARQQYPDLFKDPDIEQEIADRWFASKMRGESVSVSEVASRVAKRFAKAVSKAEKIGAEKVLEELSPKEQAGLAASSQTSAPSRKSLSDEEFEALRQKSRGGRLASETESTDAIAQRMKSIPWANK